MFLLATHTKYSFNFVQKGFLHWLLSCDFLLVNHSIRLVYELHVFAYLFVEVGDYVVRGNLQAEVLH